MSFEPTIVFEVLSPSTALTDRRVKAADYAAVPGILACVMLETDRAEITIRRRATGWEAETVEGLDAGLGLPEIGATTPLAALYRRQPPPSRRRVIARQVTRVANSAKKKAG